MSSEKSVSVARGEFFNQFKHIVRNDVFDSARVGFGKSRVGADFYQRARNIIVPFKHGGGFFFAACGKRQVSVSVHVYVALLDKQVYRAGNA